MLVNIKNLFSPFCAAWFKDHIIRFCNFFLCKFVGVAKKTTFASILQTDALLENDKWDTARIDITQGMKGHKNNTNLDNVFKSCKCF